MIYSIAFTVGEAAGHLHCADDTVRELATEGLLAGLKYGRDWVFPVEAFIKSINDQAMMESLGRRKRQSAAVSLHVGRPVPPALPTSAAQPNPRRGSRRTAAPSLVKTTP